MSTAAIKRVGMVVKLNPDYVNDYRKLHADDQPGVRDLLSKYHMKNFSIFLHKIGDEWFEFGYYEYHGSAFESDMAMLAEEPRNKAWLEVCDPMQMPLPGEQGWAEMEHVYFND